MKDYKFSVSFRPLELRAPLWQIKIDRPLEFSMIESLVNSAPNLANVIEISKLTVKTDCHTGSSFLEAAQKENKSLSWLCNTLLDSKSKSLDISRKLHSLLSNYEPLRILQDIPEVLEAEIGSCFELGVVATGNPKPQYKWWCFSQDAQWHLLPVIDSKFKIQNFSENHSGIYRCQVQHCLDVLYDPGKPVEADPMIYSKECQIVTKKGSIWIKRHPESKRCHVGDNVRFQVEAGSGEELSYVWYHNEKRLASETKDFLEWRDVSLDMKGQVYCEIRSDLCTVRSESASLEVELVQMNNANSEEDDIITENIVVLKQPVLKDHNKIYAIGETVKLSFGVSCKFPLVYEWVKQGFSSELTESSAKKLAVTSVSIVSNSSELVDYISGDHKNVSYFLYQCVVTCPETDQTVSSVMVKVKMSTFLSERETLPLFKLALVICVEEYSDSNFFVNLKSPKNDGEALIIKLKSMGYNILAFNNLKCVEIHHVLDFVANLINSDTYFVFYFNGHAVSIQNEIYMAVTDTEVFTQNCSGFVKQSEVEKCFDSRNPLLNVFIYDSCRKELPEGFQEHLKQKDPPLSYNLHANYVRSFGTRHTMESYEKMRHGMYMKHLRKHIQSTESVGSMFELVTESFTREEDQSLVKNMMPESVNGLKQRLSLSAPMRASNGISKPASLLFKLFRYEPLQESIGHQYRLDLGVNRIKDKFEWTSDPNCDGILSLSVRPTHFDNEAELVVGFRWQDDDNSTVTFQVVGINVELVQLLPCLSEGEHEIIVPFPSCSRTHSGYVFSSKDGPIFELDGVNINSSKALIKKLQTVRESRAKFKVILRQQNELLPYKGIAEFKIPLLVNFNSLKITNFLCSELIL